MCQGIKKNISQKKPIVFLKFETELFPKESGGGIHLVF